MIYYVKEFHFIRERKHGVSVGGDFRHVLRLRHLFYHSFFNLLETLGTPIPVTAVELEDFVCHFVRINYQTSFYPPLPAMPKETVANLGAPFCMWPRVVSKQYQSFERLLLFINLMCGVSPFRFLFYFCFTSIARFCTSVEVTSPCELYLELDKR